MTEEHKHDESVTAPEPAVEIVERESLMDKISEKIHHGGDSSSSSSSSDDDDDKKEKKTKKPESPSSMKSKVYRLFGREKPVHKVLGGGKPADIFMWKDKKMSGGVLGGATAAWVLFELMEYHLLTLLCHVMIVVLAVLFLWSNATMFINKSPPKIPEVHIPEEPILQLASGLRIEINRGLSSLREIASGRDLKKFLCAIFGLWVLSIMGGWFNFLTLAYIALVLLFTVPLVYDKYEDKVDPLGEKAMIEIKKQYAVLDEKVLSKIPMGPLKNKKKD
ncbi:hypothetical protein HID58_001337 [Brassica napus]|uniref:Reticulon-like protein n=2 Tax=Brassica napus TaxID=3708 RepID=A0ABQ8EJD3_BRANA|nr:reticulon-like protein B1 [Brassica napus]KAH0941700.1 hypothetical protein HID58_001337 [Brassica napus]CAF2149429.1 unnamed protein product [Brassica napus]CDY44123.1 BnaA01g13310D [Brassica napus]